jgi:hypothetical protein
MNDKRLIRLQLSAMKFLEKLIFMFSHTMDPDSQVQERVGSVSSSVANPGDKILVQFLSQIISAVRPCLSTLFSPELTLVSGRLVISLIRSGT